MQALLAIIGHLSHSLCVILYHTKQILCTQFTHFQTPPMNTRRVRRSASPPPAQPRLLVAAGRPRRTTQSPPHNDDPLSDVLIASLVVVSLGELYLNHSYGPLLLVPALLVFSWWLMLSRLRPYAKQLHAWLHSAWLLLLAALLLWVTVVWLWRVLLRLLLREGRE